ncbi:C39 family peptidase [Geobacter grbiciae]|uniref:C39 family peptidase n=1 Tax=Geobacter grbiciae TaxID=155042 RepID=UPI001C021931|nr:C39 family peptidase [Geobacter grbiciae]MBT1074573.1 C39 family peptidase [Geobacter grbiciae]
MLRIFICCLLLVMPSLSLAGVVTVPAATGGDLFVKVKSLKELRFRTVIKQQFDFSCGSAALATLLAYHYEDKVTEQDIFKDMYEKGNQEKIRREGFSLLDIKNYLGTRGYRADGFRTSLDKLASIGVPAIVLINHNGYRHFVVVKGISQREVLLGDPAAGLKRMARADFEPMWNGILFLIRNKKDVAQNYFNRSGEWSVQAKAPLGLALSNSDLARVTFLLPGNNDF